MAPRRSPPGIEKSAAEAVASVQARLGRRVKVSIEENGQVRRSCEGVLKPGLDGSTEAVPVQSKS
jgi:hypothetical protein